MHKTLGVRWDKWIWIKILIPLRNNVIMNFTLHGVRAHVTWYLKDGIDNHPNWLAWYKRDLTDCLFLLTWHCAQRVLGRSLYIVFSTGRFLVLIFRGILPGHLHYYSNTCPNYTEYPTQTLADWVFACLHFQFYSVQLTTFGRIVTW